MVLWFKVLPTDAADANSSSSKPGSGSVVKIGSSELFLLKINGLGVSWWSDRSA